LSIPLISFCAAGWELPTYACVYCGATEASSGAYLHLDHLTPQVVGGLDVAENLVVSCRACNCARHDMPLPAWCRSRKIDVRAIRAQARRALPAV